MLFPADNESAPMKKSGKRPFDPIAKIAVALVAGVESASVLFALPLPVGSNEVSFVKSNSTPESLGSAAMSYTNRRACITQSSGPRSNTSIRSTLFRGALWTGKPQSRTGQNMASVRNVWVSYLSIWPHNSRIHVHASRTGIGLGPVWRKWAAGGRNLQSDTRNHR